jgi:hypothetical protein
MCLNYQEIGFYFADNPVQMLIVDKRVSFDGNPSSFNSSYFCGCNFLPRDLIFVHIKNNNALGKYLPSRMYVDKKMIISKCPEKHKAYQGRRKTK